MEDKVVIGNAESAYISQSVQEKSKSNWWIIIIIVVLAAAAVIGIFAIKNEEHEKKLKAEAQEVISILCSGRQWHRQGEFWHCDLRRPGSGS